MCGLDYPVGNCACFRFSTVAGDTVWECITKDNSTQNVTVSGVAPVALQCVRGKTRMSPARRVSPGGKKCGIVYRLNYAQEPCGYCRGCAEGGRMPFNRK